MEHDLTLASGDAKHIAFKSETWTNDVMLRMI